MILHKYISQRCKNDLFYCVDSGFVYSSCMLYFYFHALGIMITINMYRKVTTLINFAAFVLFWIIMLLFHFPLDAYGQESRWGNMNPVREGYLRSNKDFAVDSVKYPIGRYRNSVISTNSGVFTFTGCYTGIPYSRACTFTGVIWTSLPLPFGLSGWVTTAVT